MKPMAALRTASALAIAGALAAGCASEQQVASGPAPTPTTSVEQADQRLAAVTAERAAIEARFVERERVCYQKFFVTRCLDEAKERRRSALAAQRSIEIEAEHFKRKAKVEERDRAMAEAEARYREEEARMAAQPPAAPRQPTEEPPPRPSPVAERIARHNAQLKKAQTQEQAEAARRQANVRDYEARKRESEERQRKVAERMAEKRAKEAKKEAATPPASNQPPVNGQ